MVCNIQGHKIFTVVCNVGLLFTGLALLILGMKMKDMMSLIMLDQVPAVIQAVNAVVATGFFISVTGGTGICGTSYEIPWLMAVYLGGLFLIIIMEFAIGVTLVTVKNAVEEFMINPECINVCRITLQTVILDLAMPSAITMMSIIIMQALMVYSGSQLLFHFKNNLKNPVTSSTSVAMEHVTMPNGTGLLQTAGLQPHLIYAPPHPGYRFSFSHAAYVAHQPHLGYLVTQSASRHRALSVLDDLGMDPPPYSAVEHQSSMMRMPEIEINPTETTRSRNVSTATDNGRISATSTE